MSITHRAPVMGAMSNTHGAPYLSHYGGTFPWSKPLHSFPLRTLMQLLQVVMIIKTRSSSNRKALINSPIILFLLKADQHLYNFLLLNAFLDPIVYAVRIREVQRGYIRLFCRWRCCHKLPFMRNLYQHAYEDSTHCRQARTQSFTFNTDLNSTTSALGIQSRSSCHKQNSFSPKLNERKKGNNAIETLL